MSLDLILQTFPVIYESLPLQRSHLGQPQAHSLVHK